MPIAVVRDIRYIPLYEMEMKMLTKTTKQDRAKNVLLASLAKQGRELRAEASESERQMWAKRAAAALLGKPLPIKL